MQAAQLNETLSTCRFAQRMMLVAVDAQKNIGGLSSVHGNLVKLDPLMQQYLEVGSICKHTCAACMKGGLRASYGCICGILVIHLHHQPCCNFVLWLPDMLKEKF